MAYVTEWERLADVLERVMAAGSSRDQAQAYICQAIADRTVRFRCGPQRNPLRLVTSRTLLDGKDVHVPTNLKPEALDWERSRPVKPWAIRREIFGIPGFWDLEWIDLSRTDVTNVLCGAERPTPATSTRESAPESQTMLANPHQGSGVRPELLLGVGPARRRGARPKKFEQTRDAMRSDIQQGRRTVSELDEMLEKELCANYAGVSRDTARRARSAVLSEFEALNSRQIPTNDK